MNNFPGMQLDFHGKISDYCLVFWLDALGGNTPGQWN